jgi:cell wall-associated NlpC family hydrolase
VEEYRGRAFLRGADGPDPIDCYGLVVAVLAERFGVTVPPLLGPARTSTPQELEGLLRRDSCPWVPIHGEVRPGDALAFVRRPGDLHVGVAVAPGWMLHATADLGVCTARYDDTPWMLLLLRPHYRHRELVA